MSLQPSKSPSCCLPKPIIILVIKSCKIHPEGKNIIEQFKSLVTRLTDIKSTLQDGTPSTFVKEIIGLKGKFSMEIIGAYLPFGITTGGKEVFSLLLASKVGEEIM